ncbi:zinc-binding alcohol dehydrogenase [Humibacter ginsengisoli]
MVVMDTTWPRPSAVQPDANSAVALWTTGVGTAELRSEPLTTAIEGEATVRTLWTGVSRGTETLVARGRVPVREWQRMRAPFQAGDFPFPVKYGYLAVGVVDAGPDGLKGRTVFALHPHQSRFTVPVAALTPVPDTVPTRRAVLAGAVETAINIVWDARPQVGDRIVIVGAGLIGCAVAAVLNGIRGIQVTLVEVDAARAPVAAALGADLRSPSETIPDADVVIEASGAASGLQWALRAAPTDGEVIVASWYGDEPLPLDLGADFHSRRLTIRSSQVGAVALSRRSHRTTNERLALAMHLLQDPIFDALLGETSSWRALPAIVASLAEGTGSPLCHTIDWSAE